MCVCVCACVHTQSLSHIRPFLHFVKVSFMLIYTSISINVLRTCENLIQKIWIFSYAY